MPPWSEGWSLQKTRDTPLLRREGPGRPATSLATTLRSCHNARVSRLCPRQARETPQRRLLGVGDGARWGLGGKSVCPAPARDLGWQREPASAPRPTATLERDGGGGRSTRI